MTIKTLEHIHRLLKEEADRTTEEYKAARKLQHEFEDREVVDRKLVKNQEDAADELMLINMDALNALQEFEEQEW